MPSVTFEGEQIACKDAVDKEENLGIDTDGLVAYYKLDGDAKDSAGNNNGVINGNPANVGGVFGDALSFDGVDDFINVWDFGNVAPTSEITISMWLKMSITKQQSAIILNPDDGLNRINFHPCYSNGNTYWDFGDITMGGRLSKANPSDCADNRWHHYALTASSSSNSMNIYLDGVLWTSKSGMDNFSQTIVDLQIGGRTSYFLNGVIDELKIYNKAKTY